MSETKKRGGELRKKRDGKKKEDAAARYGNRPAREALAAPSLSEARVTPPKSEESRHRAHERRYWARQLGESRFLNKLTAAAAGVGLIGLVFIYFGISETHQGTIDANRAWVTLNGPMAVIKVERSNETDDVWLKMENIGREPALNSSSYVRLFWFRPISKSDGSGYNMRDQVYPDNDTCSDVSLNTTEGAIWPDKTQAATIGGQAIASDPGFRSGRVWLGVQACVVYTTFGKRHFSRVCYVYTPFVPQDMTKWVWSFCQGAAQQDAD